MCYRAAHCALSARFGTSCVVCAKVEGCTGSLGPWMVVIAGHTGAKMSYQVWNLEWKRGRVSG